MDFGGEEDIELSLGLSIGGGGCRKRQRTEGLVSEAPVVGGRMEAEEVDLVKRKEMQALRRQEARRKREEKKQMKRSGVVTVARKILTIENADGSGRAAVDDGDERGVKRERIESGLQSEAVKSDAVEGADQSCTNLNEQATSASAYAFPIYAYPSFPYVPFANGFAFPCIAPVYTPASDASNKSVANPTVSFRPFQGGNRNGLNEEGSVKAVSNGSVGCCSSAVSENRSISSQDGSSSDSASHWSRPRSGKTELHSSSGSDVPGSSERRAFSNPSAITNVKKANNAPPATPAQPTSAKDCKEVSTAAEPKPANIPISRSTSLPQPKTPITKDSNSPGKPPRPQAVDNQKTSSPLSQMPCVSATGNGPDGKTITGFLYRYNTTAEVSIVCVCHGESFSPAEFVKHAGGIDITHPLRHITVVPSAF